MTGGGVYVSLERFLVEGMVRMQDMPQSRGRDDQWQTDERTGRLRATRSGASLGIGEVVTVKIQRVDLPVGGRAMGPSCRSIWALRSRGRGSLA